MRPKSRANRLEILSGYESGLLALAIEWVGRGSKPIAEVCSGRFSSSQLCSLKRDIGSVLSTTNEPGISAYLLHRKNGWCEYGVYRFAWALEALLYVSKHNCAPWLQGLVFGYSPEAIDCFCREHEPTQLTCCTSGTLEIVHGRKRAFSFYRERTRSRQNQSPDR